MLITDTHCWLGDGTTTSEILAWLRHYGETSVLVLAIVAEVRIRKVYKVLRKLERAEQVEHAGRLMRAPHSHNEGAAPNPALERWRLVGTPTDHQEIP